ncbi:helix-turn-helix transcriptional regulator [Streptomyces griseoviridis]
MPASGRPTVRSRRLGTALRAYRLAAKLDQLEAADIIAASQARISRLETGHVTARVIEVRLLLDAYGIKDPDVRAKLEELAKHSKNRGWWLEHAAHLRPDYLDHIALEDDATYIREWQPVLVPGLLQTPAYAEATISAGPNYISPEQLEHLVMVRAGRKAKIDRGDAVYSAILWEAVIAHPLMSVEVHRDQLSAILEVAKRRNVTLQVLPFSAGAIAGSSYAFSSFSFDSEPVVEAVTMENLLGTSIIEPPQDLFRFSNAYDQLRSAALSPEASARFIRKVLADLEKEAS